MVLDEFGLVSEVRRPKVLVVDDSSADRRLAEVTLAHMPIDVVSVSNAKDACNQIANQDFVAVLLDVNMPDCSGIELLAQLQTQRPQSTLPPVLLMTGMESNLMPSTDGYAVGAVDVMRKPLSVDVVVPKLQVFLDLWLARQALQEALDQLRVSNERLAKELDERRRMESLLRHQAYHDGLTGLPNRELMLDRIQQSIERAVRSSSNFALMYIDLDAFKHINDTLGHGCGDSVLREVARRLTRALRRTDTAARIAGDEFAVILESPISAEDAHRIAGELAELLTQPYTVYYRGDAVHPTLTASIGLAMYPHHGTGVQTLITAADAAMYQSKHSGGGRAHWAMSRPLGQA